MSELIPRYLAPFHPKRVPHYFADVVIIGGGLAGLRAAMSVGDSCGSRTAPTPKAASPA